MTITTFVFTNPSIRPSVSQSVCQSIRPSELHVHLTTREVQTRLAQPSPAQHTASTVPSTLSFAAGTPTPKKASQITSHLSPRQTQDLARHTGRSGAVINSPRAWLMVSCWGENVSVRPSAASPSCSPSLLTTSPSLNSLIHLTISQNNKTIEVTV